MGVCQEGGEARGPGAEKGEKALKKGAAPGARWLATVGTQRLMSCPAPPSAGLARHYTQMLSAAR